MILSLYWSKFTANAAKLSMIAGLVSVVFFKFAAGKILIAIKLEQIADYLGSLDVILPSFIVGFTVAIVVSLLDKKGQANLEGVKEDLEFAKTGKES